MKVAKWGSRLLCVGILVSAGLAGGVAMAKEAQEYYTLGMEAMAQQDWKGAKKQFERAIEEKKDFADAYNKLGMALFNMEKDMEAITKFKEAVFLNPRLTEAWYHLGLGYEALGKFDLAAEDKFGRAIGVDPRNDLPAVVQAYFHRGLVRRRMQEKRPEDNRDFGLAIADFEEAAKLDPSFAEAHNELGRLYYLIGRYPEAIRQFSEAIREHKEYAEAYSNRGVAYWKDGNWDMALADCRKAVELAPKFAGGHYNLAEVLFAKMEVYRSRDGQQPEIEKGWGIYHDEAQKAIDEYNQAAQYGEKQGDPRLLDYWLGLGKAYHGYHDYEHAIEAYKHSYKIKRWNKDATKALEAIEKEKKGFMSHYPKPTPVEQ